MKINKINIFKESGKHKNQNNLVSFKAMKKADFRGIDFAVVEKFKAPIEKFDVLADFQNWAGNLVEKIKNTNFLGRQAETIAQRKGMLKDWFNYVIEENGAYTKAIQLLILSAITKNLGKHDDNLPPTLNKGVLADCVSDLNKELEKDKKAQFDFNKMYQNKLRAFYLEDTKTGESGTKWVVIPSKEHDPKNFESNVEKLKTLSYKTWCTKSYNAEPYLSEGDFHVYLENGEPKIGVRFIDGNIQEIQGELNNFHIPLKYFDETYNHIKGVSLNNQALREIQEIQKVKKDIIKIKKDLCKITHENRLEKIIKLFGVQNSKDNIVEKFFDYFGIQSRKNNEGKLILSKYSQPHDLYTFKDVGIDENELFKDVVEIEGNANFIDSDLKSLYGLKKIGGWAWFRNSKIKDIGELESIKLWADFSSSKIKDLKNLYSIGSSAYFDNSEIVDLGELVEIGGKASFRDTKINNLKNLKKIRDDVYFEDSQVTNFENLQYIGGNVHLGNSKLTKDDFRFVEIKGEIFD